MSLTKIVNGVAVALSPQEEAAVRAEWATADAAAPPVPASVSMRQARRALRQAGLLEAVPALPEPQRTDAQIDWEFAQEVRRNFGLVQQLGPALGLSENAIDDLFRQAAGIQ